MKVDRLADLAHDLGPERVDPDEEPLEQPAVGQAVAARVARDSLVGVDGDDGRVLLRARDGVPGGAKRRVEREAVVQRLDGR